MKFLFTCMLLLALFLFAANESAAHDVQGLVFEGHARENFPQAFDGLNTTEIDRLRVFQMTGADVNTGAAILGQFAVNDQGGPEQVFLKNYRWPQGKILTACFFDGNRAEHVNVLRVFDSVLEYTNLGLAVTQAPCPVRGVDIQIKINTDGCSSYYGRAAKRVIARDPNEATIKLCNRANPSRSGRSEATVAHEFLHTLGFVHEQQHSDQRCYEELDLKKVGLILFPKLDEDKRADALRVNVMKLSKSVPNAVVEELPYDNSSLTHYRLTKAMFKPGIQPTCILAEKNLVLSSGDKRMLRAMYPSGVASKLSEFEAATPLTAVSSLQTVVVSSSPDKEVAILINDCMQDGDCQQSILNEINAIIASQSLGSTSVSPDKIGLETGASVFLVTPPKSEPGTGNSGCSVWPFCFHEAQADFMEGQPFGLLGETDIPDATIVDGVNTPPVNELPGVGGPFCQGLLLCNPGNDDVGADSALPSQVPGVPNPLDPVQEPGPLGPFCLNNPLCDQAIDGLNNHLLGTDLGVAK